MVVFSCFAGYKFLSEFSAMVNITVHLLIAIMNRSSQVKEVHTLVKDCKFSSVNYQCFAWESFRYNLLQNGSYIRGPYAFPTI